MQKYAKVNKEYILGELKKQWVEAHWSWHSFNKTVWFLITVITIKATTKLSDPVFYEKRQRHTDSHIFERETNG